MDRFHIFLIFILVISIGFNIAQTQRSRSSTDLDLPQETRKEFPYLAPRILIDDPTDTLINFLPLRGELREMTKNFQDSFALYFEYLPTGTSIGINEKNEFSAASLIKVPIVMAYFHQKERLGTKEGSVVTIEEEYIDSGFGNLWKKGAGTKISLDEAVRLSIVESDNTAVLVLAGNTNEEDFAQVYEGLDIDLKIKYDEVILSPKQYASILKALYFSSVLTKEHSQEILHLLTKTKFNDKLPAGVPKEVPVAHKFGLLGSELFQDCGIVYVPKRPYLLCMISHSNEIEARERMQRASQSVYNYVSTVNKNK